MTTRKKSTKKTAVKAARKRPAKRPSLNPCEGVITVNKSGNAIIIKLDDKGRCRARIEIRCRGCTSFAECVWDGTQWVCTDGSHN